MPVCQYALMERNNVVSFVGLIRTENKITLHSINNISFFFFLAMRRTQLTSQQNRDFDRDREKPKSDNRQNKQNNIIY